MKNSPEIAVLAREIQSRIRRLPVSNTPSVRVIRREISRRMASAPPGRVLQLASHLLTEDSNLLRFFSYELIRHHRCAWEELTPAGLLKLGKGLDSWSAVDEYAMLLAGPMWAEGRIPDSLVVTWAASKDRWWRRAALVSTVASSRRGDAKALAKVERICTLLMSDRDDMVVKALSWALREMAKKHPVEAGKFLAEHESALAARIIREVRSKLKTGLKTPRLARTRA